MQYKQFKFVVNLQEPSLQTNMYCFLVFLGSPFVRGGATNVNDVHIQPNTLQTTFGARFVSDSFFVVENRFYEFCSSGDHHGDKILVIQFFLANQLCYSLASIFPMNYSQAATSQPASQPIILRNRKLMNGQRRLLTAYIELSCVDKHETVFLINFGLLPQTFVHRMAAKTVAGVQQFIWLLTIQAQKHESFQNHQFTQLFQGSSH